MANTSIEWTQKSWNVVRGCTRVSEGCRNCYAERQAYRFSGAGKPYEGLVRIANGHPQWTGNIFLSLDKLEDPLHWKKPQRIFVNSMSDLFHEGVPFEFIDKVYAVMASCQQHIFQILTKRPERRLEYLTSRARSIEYWERAAREIGHTLKFNGMGLVRFPLWNVWEGTSVEDQKTADERIPLLLQTPAAVRWISAEPLLGVIELNGIHYGRFEGQRFNALEFEDAEDREEIATAACLDWVVCGGESGLGARPCDIDWLRSTVRQCQASSVPCFVKQLGAHPIFGPDGWDHMPENDGIKRATWDHDAQAWNFPIKDRKGGNPEEWPADLRVREYPKRERAGSAA